MHENFLALIALFKGSGLGPWPHESTKWPILKVQLGKTGLYTLTLTESTASAADVMLSRHVLIMGRTLR